MTEIRGAAGAGGRRIAIVASRFNELVVAKLVEGATDCLRHHGIAEDDLDVVWVPGAFELSLVARSLASSRGYDAVLCLGAVIRGETYHFEIVANESARGVMDVALDFGLPVANGILTTEDEAQAEARLDKGAEAVRGAVEMVRLKGSLDEKR